MCDDPKESAGSRTVTGIVALIPLAGEPYSLLSIERDDIKASDVDWLAGLEGKRVRIDVTVLDDAPGKDGAR